MARFWLRYGAQQIPLESGVVTLGRAPDCALLLDDALVSRRHALLRVTEREVVIEDQGSRNGTRVNDETIAGPHPLRDGDRVLIGTQELVLVAGRAAESRAMTAVFPVCTSCRRPLPTPTPSKCTWCGAQLGDDVGLRSCPSCATLVPRSLRSCERCGAELAPPTAQIPQIEEMPTFVIRPGDRQDLLVVSADETLSGGLARACSLHQDLVMAAAADAPAALRAAERVPPTMVVLDLDAVGEEGARDLLRRLRGDAGAGPAVILCGGADEREGRAVATRLRAHLFVHKPASAILLVSKIRYLLWKAERDRGRTHTPTHDDAPAVPRPRRG